MAILIPKCAVIKTKPDAHVYLLNNRPITEASPYKDLGVNWDTDLKFRTHVTETAKTAGRLTHMIFCTLVTPRPRYLPLTEAQSLSNRLQAGPPETANPLPVNHAFAWRIVRYACTDTSLCTYLESLVK